MNAQNRKHIRTTADQMTVSLSRLIRDGERVFHGVNSPLPMVAIFLARRLHAPNSVLIEVAGAVDPRPRFLPKSSNDPELCRGSAFLLGGAEYFDLFARGRLTSSSSGGPKSTRPET